jgi:flavin reductase (DIM6/NTAB) family NADH-FMN oxidoreductase RutF
MKQKIDVFDYAGHICKAMKPGILLTTKSGDKVNTMTIGWGMIGVEWGKPVFLALVRQSRHTKKLLDANGEFTVNIPLDSVDKKIIGFCGSKSGADVDKIKELGLTLEEPEVISVPGIRQLPLTLECKVLYQQTQDASKFPQSIVDRYYPQPYDDHTVYYGEIVSAYIIKE